jgi:hypothetical protein
MISFTSGSISVAVVSMMSASGPQTSTRYRKIWSYARRPVGACAEVAEQLQPAAQHAPEVLGAPRLLQGEQGQAGERRRVAALDRLGVLPGEVVEGEAEPRHERDQFVRRGEQRLERGRPAPPAVAVGHDQREHDREPVGPRVLAEVRLPDLDHVAEQPQRKPWIRPGLVLAQHVDADVVAARPHREQQVGVAGAQGLADEAARAQRQRREVEQPGDRRPEHVSQLGRGVLWQRERRLEQRVVRGHGGGHRPRTLARIIASATKCRRDRVAPELEVMHRSPITDSSALAQPPTRRSPTEPPAHDLRSRGALKNQP